MTPASELFYRIDAIGKGEIDPDPFVLYCFGSRLFKLLVEVPFEKDIIHLAFLLQAFEIDKRQLVEVFMIKRVEPCSLLRGAAFRGDKIAGVAAKKEAACIETD